MASTSLTSTGVRFPNNSDQFSALPNNTIAFWSGSIASIPTGWNLCDGTNGTPDLRDRFVVGAGSTYSVGSTGGADQVSLTAPQLPSHSHPVVASIDSSGSHAHTVTIDGVGNHGHPGGVITAAGPIAVIVGTGPVRWGNSGTFGGAGSHSHGVSINAVGDHVHTISVSLGDSGAGDPHENRPPFYSVAFIMLA
jgi:microcystin-dependent protein